MPQGVVIKPFKVSFKCIQNEWSSKQMWEKRDRTKIRFELIEKLIGTVLYLGLPKGKIASGS